MASSQRRQRLSRSKLRQLRRRQRRRQRLSLTKARQDRRQLRHNVSCLPPALLAFFAFFSPSFTRPTFWRFTLLAVAAILTTGCSTVANLLRTLGCLAPGDPSDYHRVFSHRRWSAAGLARALAGWIFDHLCDDGPILLAADDTVSEHPGDKVYGKGCHRDAVRSSHRYTAFRWGHKWLVLAVLVRLPFAQRFWALPILVVLCRSEKEDIKDQRPHKTPAQVLAQMLLVLRRWFPQRRFLCAADGGFASHELAGSVQRSAGQVGLVSRFYADAALYDLPPKPQLKANGKRQSAGRPRVRGAKQDTPEQVVAKTSARERLRLSWYGGSERAVEVVSGTGHWYRANQGLVEVRWVFVHDVEGTHRDEYFFSTELSLSAQEVVQTYTRRWNLETTFEEMRSYIGLETTRGRKKETVLRVEPCLFGLYSVVACLYRQLPAQWTQGVGVKWQGKKDLTFSDAITAVRRWLWVEGVFRQGDDQGAFEKLPQGLQQVILNGLAPAA
jgi:hypothetical protein